MQGMQVYLLEDALELWEATVKATPAPASQELLELFPYLISCLEFSSITLRRVLEIVDSYVLLAPREIIENYRVQLFGSFAGLLKTLKPEATGMVTRIVEVLIRAAKQIGGDAALKVVGVELVNSQFLVNIFATLRESYDANKTTGPNKRYPPNAVMVTDFFSVLARIVLANTEWFMEIIRMVSEREQQTVGEYMKWLLEEWFGHVCISLKLYGAEIDDEKLTQWGLQFPNMGHPSGRKLNCFALTMLLETNQKWILERLQDLMIVWTDVVTELRDEDGQAEYVDWGWEGRGGDRSFHMSYRESRCADDLYSSLVYWKSEEDNSAEPETPERARRTQVSHGQGILIVLIWGGVG